MGIVELFNEIRVLMHAPLARSHTIVEKKRAKNRTMLPKTMQVRVIRVQ